MTISTNYITKYTNTNNLERQKNKTSLSKTNVFDCFKSNLYIKKEEKVKPKEAVKLIAEGAISQVKTIINQIIKHPIKALSTTIITTSILMALPLIGIPTAVGGSFLALGVAGVSAFKLAKNTYNVVQNTKNGEYNKARKNYKEIGNSGLDLALSLPFLPKSISNVKEFAKYGKIKLNANAIIKLIKNNNPLKTIKIINEANANLKQNYNYQKIVDKKLKEWDLPTDEVKAIRKELLDFNVPEDDIAKVVVKKLAQHKGIKTTPYVRIRQLREGVQGSYSPYAGVISLPDKTKPPLPLDVHGPRQLPTKPGELSPDGKEYIFQMVDSQTKKTSVCTAPKKVVEDFSILKNDLARLSPQARQISTVVHEFEHFDQHSKIVRLKGVYEKCSPKAKKLYEKVIQEQGVIKPNTELARETEKYLSVKYSENSNYIKYIQNALEVGARKAQAEAIKTPNFRRLDSIFKELPPLEKQNLLNTIVPSVIQEKIVKV